MNPLLKEERDKVSFNIQEMGDFFYGSRQTREFYLQVSKIFSEDPILSNDPSELSLSRKDLFKLYAKKVNRFQELLNYTEFDGPYLSHFPQQLPGSLHKYMFIPTIKHLGTEEQVKKFLEPSLRMEIIGCYAQTEMGHGSDVQNLETTATFDKNTDEFILHSPTLTSTKWWPGDMGKVANYAVTHAQLYIDGKHYGLQTFIVPIRDIETHRPFPGIQVGDIGPKVGYNVKDNGFLKFTNYHVPRENMLMKYVSVSKDGKFKRVGNEKLGYATMMYVRGVIADVSSEYLAQAVTIATRYSLVRTQFKNDDSKELKVMDYQTQMDKLLPLIAMNYAFKSGAQRLKEMYAENLKLINENQDFSLMQDLHASLAGTKAFWSWDICRAIETARMACGGHGFSSYSGFTTIYTEYAPNATHEGENTVMALQTARYLVKCLGELRKKKPLPNNVEYLSFVNEIVAVRKCNAKKPEDFDLNILEECAKANAAYNIYSAFQKMMQAVKGGLSMKEAWNEKAGIELVEGARAHTTLFTYKAFVQRVQKLQEGKVKRALSKLCELFILHKLLQYPLGLIESSYISSEQFKMLKIRKEDVLSELRPDAIGFVDAFAIPDNSLKSAIGRYDGNAYETLWDWVRNKNDFNEHEVLEGIKEHILPLKHVQRPPVLTPKL